jgi:hypothetical protein
MGEVWFCAVDRIESLVLRAAKPGCFAWQYVVLCSDPVCCCLRTPVLVPQIQTLDIPGEVKAGYSPIGFVRCGRAACKITKINWKVSC